MISIHMPDLDAGAGATDGERTLAAAGRIERAKSYFLPRRERACRRRRFRGLHRATVRQSERACASVFGADNPSAAPASASPSAIRPAEQIGCSRANCSRHAWTMSPSSSRTTKTRPSEASEYFMTASLKIGAAPGADDAPETASPEDCTIQMLQWASMVNRTLGVIGPERCGVTVKNHFSVDEKGGNVESRPNRANSALPVSRSGCGAAADRSAVWQSAGRAVRPDNLRPG